MLGVPLAIIGIGLSVWGGWHMFVVGLVLIFVGVTVLLYKLVKIHKKEVPPMEIAVEKSKTIWGLWHTGDRMCSDFISKGEYKQFKRILLMKPYSDAFNRNIEISRENPQKMIDQILLLTELALTDGIPIKWYKRFEGYSLVIYDEMDSNEPISPKAYCVVELLESPMPREHRRHWRVNNGDKESYFNSKLDQMKDIWNDNNLSEEPNIEEWKRKNH